MKNPIVKNIAAVLAGWLLGSVINLLLVNLGPSIIPVPEGVDLNSMEGMKETIHLFKPQNFIFPFLGHALGTLVGAFLAAKIVANHKMKFALGIGLLFLFGGIYMIVLIGGPLWFIVLDLVAAYLPMAWLGGKWATKGQIKLT